MRGINYITIHQLQSHQILGFHTQIYVNKRIIKSKNNE